MAVTAARGSEGTRLAWNSSGGKPSAGFGRQRICLFHIDHLIGYSIGTINSLLRIIFRFFRAASSIERGSFRNRSISSCKDRFTLRSASTSVCIEANCSEATSALARVRIFTVTHTANVASMIMPKTTQEGITPPRRRTSLRLPMISAEICCISGVDTLDFRTTRCDLIRSSTQ